MSEVSISPGSTTFHDEGYGFDIFGLNPQTLVKATTAASVLYEKYFRVDSKGAERIPPSGAAILIANHGGILPIDAAILCVDVLRRTRPARIPRPIADHFVPRIPLVGTLFARCGAVSGTRTNVTRLLERGELVAIWPEGTSGPAKRFRQRYQLQAWRVGFAELAIRHRTPVIPVAIVGAEESWPVAIRLRAHLFGAPYLPLPASPVPLPTRYHIRYGEPIRLDRPGASSDFDASDPRFVAAAAARVRTALVTLLDYTLVLRRGVFR